MKFQGWRIILGIGLLALGVLALVMEIFTPQGDLVGLLFGGLFALVGVGFLSALLNDRKQWWAAIPGTILLFLGVMMLLSSLFSLFHSIWRAVKVGTTSSISEREAI